MTVLQYASGMEVFQLLTAVVGLALAMWGIWLATEDAIELTDSPPDDLRRLIALGNMRGQMARLSVHGVLVFVGVVSILLPPPPPEVIPGAVTELEQSTFIRLGLILVTIILVIDAIMERRQRYVFTERMSHIAHTTGPRGETQSVSVLIGGTEIASGKVIHTQVPVVLPLTPTPVPDTNNKPSETVKTTTTTTTEHSEPKE